MTTNKVKLKLKARIIEKGVDRKDICKDLDIKADTLTKKLNGKLNFKISEVLYLTEKLDIKNVNEYFK